MRFCLVLFALTGCHKLFGLVDVSDPPPIPDARPTFAGCSDETREGFADPALFPAIAACAGAWSIPGLSAPAACGHAAGNTGTQVLGTGCAAHDLCATGWHVCSSRLDVLSHLPPAKTCADGMFGPSTFFATAQSGPGGGECGMGTNDFLGCGTYGPAPFPVCTPLDRSSDNMCFTLRSAGGWDCPDDRSEVTTVTKSDPTAGGGVLCCQDDPL